MEQGRKFWEYAMKLWDFVFKYIYIYNFIFKLPAARA